MSKAYTEAEFSSQITQDRNWRLKEISDLKGAIRRADPILQRVLLRALITVSYAHWEGYVRFSARKYMEHIALRKFQFAQLDRQFFKNYFLPRLGGLLTSKASISERCKLVDEILDSSSSKFSKVNDDLINTKANLNFEVFCDICTICGVHVKKFEGGKSFIDVIILKRRNEIAHGENTFVSINDLDEVADRIISMMRMFGDELENQISLQSYRAA